MLFINDGLQPLFQMDLCIARANISLNLTVLNPLDISQHQIHFWISLTQQLFFQTL